MLTSPPKLHKWELTRKTILHCLQCKWSRCRRPEIPSHKPAQDNASGLPHSLTPANRRYFTSTVAPASANFFLMFSASSLETPSFTGLGAPSTRSLASFRPRLVTSRTALITLILFAPTSLSTTLNSVFSSAGAAPAAAPAPPPAMTTGAAAAAETPRRSSSFFTSCAASSSDSPTICSSNCCKSAIAISILRYQFFVRYRVPGFQCVLGSCLRQTRGSNLDRNPWHLIT